MRVSHIRFQPIEGGTLGGQFALHVTLGAEDDSECLFLTSDELLSHIHEAFKKLDIKTQAMRGVLFDVREADDVETTEMLSVLGTLRDWGMITIAWVNEKKRSAWFELLYSITVFVRSQHWPNFRVSEIRFIPESDSWIEPEVFTVNANAPGYVQLSANNFKLAGQLLSFVTSARRPWGVILPQINVRSVEFPLSKEESE